MEINNLEKTLKDYFSKFKQFDKTVATTSSDKTFYIYTTGLADSNIIKIWKECRYKNIIDQIPKNFNNIIIYHYDPIQVIHQNITKQNIDTILKTQDDESKKTNKKTTQIFYKDYFDVKKIDTSKPYIVLDFASIYYYNYDKGTKDFYLTVKNNTEKININCIYIPYPAEVEDPLFPKNNGCNNYYENIKYFTYDLVNNKITTFIQLFFRILDNDYPRMYQNIYITDFINRELYHTQVINYVKRYTNNNEDIWLQNNIKKDLFIEFFQKLFEPGMNKNKIQEIQNYGIYKLLEQKFNPLN